MKVRAITVENFLGVREARLEDIDTPVTVFCGPNFAGKSSLQEAVRMALVGESVRVRLKREYPALVNDAATEGWASVEVEHEGKTLIGTITLPGGQRVSIGDVPALPYVLDAQRFPRLEANDRRSFLLGLMGVQITPDTVAKRMLDDGLDAAKTKAVTPLLRAGFDAAHKDAKSKATEAKGAWRALTGETYGAVKAASWMAEKPFVDAAAAERQRKALVAAEDALAAANQWLGSLQSDKRRAEEARTRIDPLKARAAQLTRIQTKLEHDQAGLVEWEAKLKSAAAKATGVADNPHCACPSCGTLLQVAAGPDTLRLESYSRPAGTFDADAAAALPSIRRSRDLMASAVDNDKRDLEAARQAAAELGTLQDVKPPSAADLEEAGNRVQSAKTQRDKLSAAVAALDRTREAAAIADEKTAKAAAHHADVVAWDTIADALAPDGIPGKLLGEALGPINERLAQSAEDAQWLKVGINADMSITTYGNRLRSYELLSVSERWRVDAMLAEAISFIAGLKLVVLDGFDVLDLQGRTDLLEWFDILADSGELDSALLFGTLKSLPTLPSPRARAYWIADGVLQAEHREAMAA